MPADKPIEARHQTQHKLEVMARYWGIWCRILAQAGRSPFCTRRLWLVDTMAGTGLHESIGDPDGVVPGTPFQALLAARATQREFAGVTVSVRAIDIDPVIAGKVSDRLIRYRGSPPEKVDVRVDQADWVKAVPAIAAEIVGTPDHPKPVGAWGHEHRSLWFIDPFGVEPLDHATIMALPPHSEVIVNFDENAVRRHAGKDLALLGRIYGDDRWRAALKQPTGAFAEIYAESFARRFEFRTWNPLVPSGAQDRFLIHLAETSKAIAPFDRAHKAALKAGTLIAGDLTTTSEKHKIVKGLHERFAGQRLTIDEMYDAGAGFQKVQLRALCQTAEDLRYGSWTAKNSTLDWFPEREPEPEPPNLGL